MTQWLGALRRARQTRTDVHDPKQAARQRVLSCAAAYRTMAAAQLLAQMMLWVTLRGYDEAGQAVWQAALALALPLGVQWALWRKGAGAAQGRAGAWAGAALLPCLMLDALVLLWAISGQEQRLIPVYPRWLHIVWPAALCWAASALAHEHGAAYGSRVMAGLLTGLFAFATVFLGVDAHPLRLWPLLGQGVARTGTAALAGAGGTWGVALLFVLPTGHAGSDALPLRRTLDGARAAAWAFIPWGMGVVWALWYGMTRPWRVGDALTVGQRLMGMARHSVSTILYQLTGVMWMLLLPVALIGCLTAAGKLLHAALPRVPVALGAGAALLPAVALLLFAEISGVIWAVLPWRAAVGLLAACALCVIARRQRRVG